MASRKAIKSVLHNFLGTYTSRYSEYDGYWLFGFLVDDMIQVKIDLIDMISKRTETAQMDIAIKLAIRLFSEQVKKAGLAISCIQQAQLDIKKLDETITVIINEQECYGYKLNFKATAVSNLGKAYEHEKSIFVTSHNPWAERRSARGDLPYFKY
jgi:hypothetical protein